MNFDVVTLFPAMFQGPLDDGMRARARRAGKVGVRVHGGEFDDFAFEARHGGLLRASLGPYERLECQQIAVGAESDDGATDDRREQRFVPELLAPPDVRTSRRTAPPSST